MATENRLIDANKLKWKLGQVTLYVTGLRFGKTIISKILESYREAVFQEIDNAPTVDAVEVVHGEWIGAECDGVADGKPVYYLWACSICQDTHISDGCPPPYNYCLNCGAKMEE